MVFRDFSHLVGALDSFCISRSDQALIIADLLGLSRRFRPDIGCRGRARLDTVRCAGRARWPTAPPPFPSFPAAGWGQPALPGLILDSAAVPKYAPGLGPPLYLHDNRFALNREPEPEESAWAAVSELC